MVHPVGVGTAQFEGAGRDEVGRTTRQQELPAQFLTGGLLGEYLQGREVVAVSINLFGVASDDWTTKTAPFESDSDVSSIEV